MSAPLTLPRGRVYLDHADGIPQELLNRVASFVAWYSRALPAPPYDLTVYLQLEADDCPWGGEVTYQNPDGGLFALDDPETAGVGLTVQALPEEHAHYTIQRVAHALEHQYQWEMGGRVSCQLVETRAAQLVTRWMQERR
jgi:hypothetical protein